MLELSLLIATCVLALLAAGFSARAVLRGESLRARDLQKMADFQEEAVIRIEHRLAEQSALFQAGISQSRQELSQSFHLAIQPLVELVARGNETQATQMQTLAAQVEALRTGVTAGLEKIRDTMEGRLHAIQADNTRQLDEIRNTVGEKLQSTLETRLGESFRIVSERLEQVHRGLGEMQRLATDVGGLQRALTNVKVRGAWGEVQLGALLDQVLAPQQYVRNVKTREDSAAVVEYAIKLPGKSEDGREESVLLPIDSKFPLEDYQRLVEAQESGDPIGVESAMQALAVRVRQSAKDIAKYLNPPATTDFAVMFLATDGLYSEIIRRSDLVERIQREHRVVIAGPATFAAFLNSLQMGFATLAIQRRSSEVWKLLGAVKSEFGKFGTILEGVKKKLDQASSTMDDAARRSRAIERKLRDVQSLEPMESQALMNLPEAEEEEPLAE